MKIYNITRFRIPALITSSAAIIVFWAYTLLVAGGFNFGIDFRAGLNITVDVPAAADEEAVRSALGNPNAQVQDAVDVEGRFIIRIADNAGVEDFQRTTSAAVTDDLQSAFGRVTIVGEEFVGTSFAASLATQTIWVTLIALGLILLYIWIRFRLNYAVSAVLAVFHDVLFLLGFIGAFQLEFSTATIAAVLTIIGYSLNDTIVIFDRIRENTRIVKDKPFNDIINLSVTQSMSRTLLTSLTTLIAIISIVIFASGTIRTFALSLVVGIIVGTYSSIYVASPILLAWHDRDAEKVHRAVTGGGRADSVTTQKSPVSRPDASPVHRQTAEEIAEATEKRAQAKARKKKKKK